MGVAKVARARVTFRIFHHDLDPDRISEMLSERPTSAHRRGDERGRKRKIGTRYKEGMWALQLYSGPVDTLNEQLVSCIPRLAKFRSGIDLLKKGNSIVELFVGCFFDGTMRMERLSAATLRQLGELGVDLSLDIYMGDEDEPSNTDT